MGNSIALSLLSRSVSANLLFLTNCNFDIGTYHQISQFLRSYSSAKQSGSYYTSISQLKLITRQTPLFSFEDNLFKYFRTTSLKANMMEILASIITYSVFPWKLKIKLAFDIFDFDASQYLNKAETSMVIISFFKGLLTMTNSASHENLDLDFLAKDCFDSASRKNGLISLDEFVTWVANIQELVDLLSRYESKEKNSGSKRYSRKKSIQDRNVRIVKGYSSRRTSHYRSSSLPYPKEKTEWKNRERDLQRLQEIFFKHADDKGYSTVGNIYQELIEDKRLKKDIEFFFHEFDFDLNKNIEFSQLIEYIEKAKSKNGYYIKSGKEFIYPSMELEPAAERRKSIDVNVLKMMFKTFDSNNDGFLNFHEFHEGLKKNFNKQTIQEVFSSYDVDKNRLIDFSEFVKIFSASEGKLDNHLA